MCTYSVMLGRPYHGGRTSPIDVQGHVICCSGR